MNTNINRKYYAFFAVALLAMIVPLWLVEAPPLVDLLNHLARIFILANYDHSPFFQQNFQVVYEPIPNMALDLIVVPLMNVFDIWTANRLFLSLTVILFAFGCHLVGAQKTEKCSFSAVLASFLIYSGTFFYGYINYVFSVALFLITFGLWLRWREKCLLKHILTLICLTFAIYLSHLSAFVFFGIAIFIVNLYDYLICPEERRRWILLARDCTLFILPTIAFLTFMNGSGNVGAVGFNTLSGKAVALFSAFRSYDLWVDLLCVGITVTIYFLLKREKQINIDRRILLVAISFIIIFLLSPKFFFTGDADLRIVLPGFVLLILSCKVNFLNGKTLALFAVAICLFTFRQGLISYRWIQISAKMTAERNLLNVIKPESRIYPLFVNDASNPEEKLERPIEHVIQYATIENSSFAPTLFAIAGQQPLVFRQPQEIAMLENEDQMKWIKCLDGNDYVWTYGVPQEVAAELGKRGETVAESGKTKIWKLNK